MFDADELNPEQRTAATHGEGPLLIVAGAGTGKTTTLAARVAWLVAERAVAPERVLLLTYSRRAAKELLTRAQRMTGRADAGRVWGGTFHAVANRLLRIHGRALGLSPSFTVLDQADGADVMNLLREELGFAARGRRFPRKDTLASIHSRVVNAGVRLDDVVQRWYPWCVDDVDGIRLIFRAYVERKRAQQTLDYDDLLLFWKALAASPVAGPQLARMFDHILVDEYQDTNAIQADILAAMRPLGTDSQPDGRRRRRAGDLRVPRRDGAQHPGVRGPVPRRDGRQARTELSLDHGDPPVVERRDRARARAPRQVALDRTDRRRAPRASRLRGRRRRGGDRLPVGARASRTRGAVEGTGRALPRGAPFRSSRDRAPPPQHPVREVRRVEVPGSRAREGRARAAPDPREPTGRGRLVPRAPAPGRDRPDGGAQRDERPGSQRIRRPIRAVATLPRRTGLRPEGRRRRDPGAPVRPRWVPGRNVDGPGRAAGTAPGLPRAGDRPGSTTRRVPEPPTSNSSPSWPAGTSRAAGSWPSSRSIHQLPRPTSPVLHRWTRTT